MTGPDRRPGFPENNLEVSMNKPRHRPVDAERAVRIICMTIRLNV